MKIAKITILTLSLLSFMQACSGNQKSGYYKGYELPAYKVTNKVDNIEFREYEPSLIAEVEVEGDREKAANEGFWVLAKYIFGKNTKEQKVAMTSPVVQKEVSEKIAMTSPVTQIPQDNKKWIIQFGMPKEYKIDTLPKPQDDRIKFKMTKPRKVVAIVFSGFWSDKKFDCNKEKLTEFVNKNNLKTINDPFIAYYDDPFTLPWNRRNEVIWEIR